MFTTAAFPRNLSLPPLGLEVFYGIPTRSALNQMPRLPLVLACSCAFASLNTLCSRLAVSIIPFDSFGNLRPGETTRENNMREGKLSVQKEPGCHGVNIPGSIEYLRVLAGDDVALPRCPHGVFSVPFVLCRSVFVVSRRGG